jgi:D-alanyl-D-alanine carboxypeptidase
MDVAVDHGLTVSSRTAYDRLTMSVEALRAYVEELLAVQGLPGLSLAVTDRSGLLASETFGLASLEAGTPVRRETYFEWGSIGKTFTAVLLLQLRDEGLLELDEPLTTYLPWFEVRTKHGPISIRHLLTHSSGLMVGAEMSADSRFDVWALRETETGFAPGTRYLYSNVGYRALGFVVEDLVGAPYPEAARTRILEPLGLAATDAAITNAGRHLRATGYARRYDDRPAQRNGDWAPATWLETGTGDGSLVGTVEDLAGFLRALLNQGAGLLERESFEPMVTPGIEAEDGWWYGCGLEFREVEGRRELRHEGSMPGFGAAMYGDLDAGIGVAAAVNGVDDGDLARSVAEAALALFRDGTHPPPVPDPFTIEDAPDYEGAYIGEAGRLELVVEGDRLVLAGEARVPLEPRRSDQFLVDHPSFARFLLGFRRENGRVVEAVHGPEVYRREDAGAAKPAAPPPEWSAYPGHYRAYNPWYSNFRVVLRRAELVLIFPWGLELVLIPLPDGGFHVGDAWSPERVRFDAIVDGAALRADYAGEAYYRVP